MPTAPGTDPDFRPDHQAVPHVVLGTDPTMFVGECLHGDFSSGTPRATEDEAVADVAEHLATI